MADYSLPGSLKSALPNARAVAPAHPEERLEVTLTLRRRNEAEFNRLIERLEKGLREPTLSRKDFAARFSAAPEDVAAVEIFARQYGLVVTARNLAAAALTVTGTVSQFNAAFAVSLQHYVHPKGSYRGRVGDIKLPAELRDIVTAVMGMDNRPQSMPHFRVMPSSTSKTTASSYTPLQVADFYSFPTSGGSGQTVGIVELGGGFTPADLTTYFSELGLATPDVLSVSVDHATNTPSGGASGPDGEVMLDIEVLGAIANEARIVVYFAPNTDAGFLDAINQAVHDATYAPSVISISWGGPESSWTTQAMTAMNNAIKAAAAMGVTVCVAAGDGGSNDGVAGTANHVDFPASSPFSLACGGTRLVAKGASISESVWNDGAQGGAGGGGVSDVFATPAWQAGLKATTTSGGAVLTHRGVPDVAGDADPESGYRVRVDGSDMVIGGTSAVAPLVAALLLRINALNGTAVGLVHPTFYKNASAFRDITSGNNGSYIATAGWDACTGLGTPNGVALLKVLQTNPPARTRVS